MSHNGGAETFEEVFGSFGGGGKTVFHSFLCEVFGQFIKGFGSVKVGVQLKLEVF